MPDSDVTKVATTWFVIKKKGTNAHHQLRQFQFMLVRANLRGGPQKFQANICRLSDLANISNHQFWLFLTFLIALTLMGLIKRDTEEYSFLMH